MKAQSKNATRRELRRLRALERKHKRDTAGLKASLRWYSDSVHQLRSRISALEVERDSVSAKLRDLCRSSREGEEVPSDISFLREEPAEAYEVPIIGQYQTVRVRL